LAPIARSLPGVSPGGAGLGQALGGVGDDLQLVVADPPVAQQRQAGRQPPPGGGQAEDLIVAQRVQHPPFAGRGGDGGQLRTRRQHVERAALRETGQVTARHSAQDRQRRLGLLLRHPSLVVLGLGHHPAQPGILVFPQEAIRRHRHGRLPAVLPAAGNGFRGHEPRLPPDLTAHGKALLKSKPIYRALVN
jgi:hypothetical protein